MKEKRERGREEEGVRRKGERGRCVLLCVCRAAGRKRKIKKKILQCRLLFCFLPAGVVCFFIIVFSFVVVLFVALGLWFVRLGGTLC